VHGNEPGRSLERVRRAQGEARQWDEVARPEQDDALHHRRLPQRQIARRRHRTRVRIARMRHDQSARHAGWAPAGGSPGVVECPPQRVPKLRRLGGVERPGHGGRPDAERRGRHRGHVPAVKAASLTGSLRGPHDPGCPSNTPATLVPHPSQRLSSSNRYSPNAYQSRWITRVPHTWQYVLWPPSSKTLPVYAYRTPLSRAMRLAWTSVSGGVGGRSIILKSGWKAVKCSGTSGPRCSTIHLDMASISPGSSFAPGISRFVISNHTFVSCFRYSSVSRTAASFPPHTFE